MIPEREIEMLHLLSLDLKELLLLWVDAPSLLALASTSADFFSICREKKFWSRRLSQDLGFLAEEISMEEFSVEGIFALHRRARVAKLKSDRFSSQEADIALKFTLDDLTERKLLILPDLSPEVLDFYYQEQSQLSRIRREIEFMEQSISHHPLDYCPAVDGALETLHSFFRPVRVSLRPQEIAFFAHKSFPGGENRITGGGLVDYTQRFRLSDRSQRILVFRLFFHRIRLSAF